MRVVRGMIGVAAAALLAALQDLVLPVYFTSIDRQGLVGPVLSALAGGLLVGSAIYAAIGARHRRRTWLTVSLGGTTAGFAVITTLHSTWTVLAGAFTVGLSNGLATTLLGVLLSEVAAGADLGVEEREMFHDGEGAAERTLQHSFESVLRRDGPARAASPRRSCSGLEPFALGLGEPRPGHDLQLRQRPR